MLAITTTKHRQIEIHTNKQ